MNNRYETTQDRRNRERPRDEQSRFDSEYDPMRHDGRESRRFETDDRYGSREEPMWSDSERSGSDRYDYDRRRQDRFDSPQGGDRYDRETNRYRGGSSDWNNQFSGGRSDGNSYDRGSQQMYRGNTGYGSELDRQRSSQQSAYSDNYDQGRWTSTGGNNRTESMFGLQGSYGDMNRDMNRSMNRGMGRYDGGMNQGQYQQGSHAGKGPKGYRRSDERIEEDVNEALAQDPQIDASEIEVKVSNGEVTLSGTVAERHLKRIAEDVAERCSGVRDVKNEIRVQRNDESGSMNQNQSKGKPNAGTGMKSSESKTA